MGPDLRRGVEDVGRIHGAAFEVDRWPSERPLYALVVLAAIAVWLLLAVSMIGIVYVVMLAVIFFLGHVLFITHLRGNGVRLGPDQMPELHARVVALSEAMGLQKVPDAYVVQAGGLLNALATRFLRSNVIVLYSDLLEACHENEDARDFIVAHELGHLRAGHLTARWLLIPGLAMPFLGSAWSRACEYTCDRYGLAASRNPERALDGLTILAAGGQHGPQVNRQALVAQREELNTIWMKIGQWLGTHPPIAHRLVALAPDLGPPMPGRGAAIGALVLLLAAIGVPTAVGIGSLAAFWPDIQAALAAGEAGGPVAEPEPSYAPLESNPAFDMMANEQVREQILALVDVAGKYQAEYGTLPDQATLEQLYVQIHSPDGEPPRDPWTGQPYVWGVEGEHFVILSTGPDGIRSDDDLYYSSAAAAE